MLSRTRRTNCLNRKWVAKRTIVFHLAKVALFFLGTIDANLAVTVSGIVQSVYSIARGIAKRHD